VHSYTCVYTSTYASVKVFIHTHMYVCVICMCILVHVCTHISFEGLQNSSTPASVDKLQHAAATHCNTLQHTATHCNALRYTALQRTTLQHTATHCNTLRHCNTLQHATSHCTTLRHAATHCNTLRHTATRCTTLKHTTQHKSRVHIYQSFLHVCRRLVPRVWRSKSSGKRVHVCAAP